MLDTFLSEWSREILKRNLSIDLDLIWNMFKKDETYELNERELNSTNRKIKTEFHNGQIDLLHDRDSDCLLLCIERSIWNIVATTKRFSK